MLTASLPICQTSTKLKRVKKVCSYLGVKKQRLAIVRALVRNPSILILDEATSALDTESEFLVQQAINRNLRGRTVIVIAHRLSTVEKADKMLVIKNGNIVQEGKHLDLINEDGVYAGLVKQQLFGTKTEEENEKADHCCNLVI